MIVLDVFGILITCFWESMGLSPAAKFIHFVATVAFSGSVSPWMFMHLKEAYDNPLRNELRDLTPLNFADMSPPEVCDSS